MSETKAAMNTDRELWREVERDYYSPSVHVTVNGLIGINVGGTVKVRSLIEWHALEERVRAAEAQLQKEQEEHFILFASLKAQLATSESALSDVASKLGLDFGRVTPAQLSKACVETLEALIVALGVAQESASDSESARQAAEGRAATLRTALEKLTWTMHRAAHNGKLHGVIDCPEQECVESRVACGFDASPPVPAARDGGAEA